VVVVGLLFVLSVSCCLFVTFLVIDLSGARFSHRRAAAAEEQAEDSPGEVQEHHPFIYFYR
jgi:hypothetical protein